MRDNGPAPFNLGKGGNYPQNPFNVAAEYANADTDIRHHFVASQIIELPFGRNRRFLSHLNGLGDAIIGGWQVNSITTLQTGTPFNIVSNGNDPNYPGLRPNLVSSASVRHKTVQEWFNPKAFAKPASQTTQPAPGQALVVGNAPRNFLFGPGFTNEDFSLFKVFSLPREMRLQIRAESFNLLNEAHYDNPIGNLAAGAQFGQIRGGYSPRVMQFAGRLTF